MSNIIRSLIVKVGADTTEFSNKMNYVSKDLKGVGKSLTNTGKSLSKAGATLTKTVTMPIVGLGAASAKAAIDFESAFAGVKKTVDANVEDLARLEKGIRDMSKEIPASAVEIAGVAEAAGQLGIEVPNILSFIRTMIGLGESTNLSADEAATALARFANITGMSQQDFNKLGSTIVDLGNNLATTESEIVEMGLRLAGAGSQIGLTEAQILSFSGALSSVGIEAEAGGSAFSKVMIDMQLASETGGKKLEEYANIAGMTGAEFKNAFENDASGAIAKFIEGLGNTESAIKVLDDMGIKEVRLRDALLRAAGASDIFTKSLDIGTTAWDENTALTKEAEQRYRTTASQIEIAKNKMTEAGITAGAVLAPHIVKTADAIANLADKFSQLSPEQQETILKMAATAAAMGPVLSFTGSITKGFGGLFDTASKVTGGVSKFSKALDGGSSILGALGTMLGPGGALLLGMAAFATAAVLIYKNWDTITASVKGAIDRVKEFFGIDSPETVEAKVATREAKIREANGEVTPSRIRDTSSASGVRWNASGGIFTKPTVLPTIAGWQGFGEAGPEAVLPLSKLGDMMGETKQTQTVVHTGTITVRGVNNKDELVAVYEDKIASRVASDNRRMPNRTSLIPI